MFTGIVEDIGVVEETRNQERMLSFQVRTQLPVDKMKLGDSICVSGTCLTINGMRENTISFDVGHESLQTTTCGSFVRGRKVHLERALSVDGRLGGHWVTGHVDGVGRILSSRKQGSNVDVEISMPPSIAKYLVPKGSITVDGVSLTINEPTPDRFRVTLVPHTQQRTLLAGLHKGESVNLEADVIGKYVHHFVSASSRAAKLDEAFLKEHGFIR